MMCSELQNDPDGEYIAPCAYPQQTHCLTVD
jgi:hypothetical protein